MPRRGKKPEPIPINDQVRMGISALSTSSFSIGRDLIRLDLMYDEPRTDRRYVAARVWMTPRILKLFANDVQEAIKIYEKNYGKIKIER
jgi:hypothetical protein